MQIFRVNLMKNTPEHALIFVYMFLSVQQASIIFIRLERLGYNFLNSFCFVVPIIIVLNLWICKKKKKVVRQSFVNENELKYLPWMCNILSGVQWSLSWSFQYIHLSLPPVPSCACVCSQIDLEWDNPVSNFSTDRLGSCTYLYRSAYRSSVLTW